MFSCFLLCYIIIYVIPEYCSSDSLLHHCHHHSLATTTLHSHSLCIVHNSVHFLINDSMSPSGSLSTGEGGGRGRCSVCFYLSECKGTVFFSLPKSHILGICIPQTWYAMRNPSSNKHINIYILGKTDLSYFPCTLILLFILIYEWES